MTPGGATTDGRRLLRTLFGAVVLTLVLSSPLRAQEPPDSVVVPDSLVADSVVADSVSADTIFYNMPSVGSPIPTGYATGIWSWDRDAIMASGAHTLAELFEEVPGLVPLLGGDYGTPAAMAAFGQSAAGYRVVRDGFELYPVDGGVVDLQRVGLVGIDRVRLDRSMAQMTVEMWSHEYDDGRPFSVVEAGTGDLDTNMFRGVYADPTALGGSVAGGLERIDTRGRGVGGEEGGNRTGAWVRYQLHLQDRAALGIDFRQMEAQTQVDAYIPTSERRDVTLRAGLRLTDGIVLEGYTGRSSYEIDDADRPFSRLGGSRRQHGGRLGLDLGSFWAEAAARFFQGALPSRRLEGRGGVVGERFGAAGAYGRGSWNGEGTDHLAARAWLGPFAGLTVFGAYASGRFGARSAPIADRTGPPPVAPFDGTRRGEAVSTERETLRVGGSASRWGVTLGGAVLYAQSDTVHPLGIELDVGAPGHPGVSRYGWEGMAVFPTMWEGVTVEGSFQWWDEEGPYLPQRVYRGSLEFHRVYKESENLEFWASVGVRGHDPMEVFVPGDGGTAPGGLERVPFYQSWYARIQVRVVTVRLYLGMDNFTFRRELQTFPGRTLPFGRSFFALRWDMWN